jgi:RHS repeat-associated protein
VTDTYTLDAFGRQISSSGTTPNPYRFGAAWGYLTETPGSGLLELGARFYWPEVGRFIQQDPERTPRSRYAYGRNEPVYWVDPTGLWEFGGELYGIIGAGFYIGRDPCGNFYVKTKAGFGFGGGGTLDLSATSPSYPAGVGRGSFYGLTGQVGLQAGAANYGTRAAIGNVYDSGGNWHPYTLPPTSPFEPTAGWPPPPRFFGFGAFGGAEGGFVF